MSTWNGTYEGVPDGGDSPSTLDNSIRDFKTSTEGRMENEHDTYVADGTAGAESKDWRHKEGSARAYYQSAEPTNQPGSNGAALGADDNGRLWVDSDDDTQKVWDGSAFKLISTPRLLVQHQESSGIDGGSAAGTTWNVRPLNTSLINTIAGASLSSDRITLPSGTYEVVAESVSYYTNNHRLQLYNITDGNTEVFGIYNGVNTGKAATATLFSTFTIAATKVFEIRHYTVRAQITNGLGGAISQGIEIYANVLIKKVA